MPNYTVSNIEDIISILNEKHNHLLKVIRGKDISKENLKLSGLSVPHTSINSRQLRMAIDGVSTALKEAKRLAK